MIGGKGNRNRERGEKRMEKAGGCKEGSQELGDAEVGGAPMKNDAQSAEY